MGMTVARGPETSAPLQVSRMRQVVVLEEVREAAVPWGTASWGAPGKGG